MRKSGIFILLGTIISLSVFVLAGILYFQPIVETEIKEPSVSQIPAVAQKVEVEVKETFKPPQPTAQETPAEPKPVQEEKRPPEVKKPSVVKVTTAAYVPPKPEKEVPLEPETDEKLPVEPGTDEKLPVEPGTDEKLPVEPGTDEKLPVEPTPETPYRTMKVIPAQPKMDLSARSILPAITKPAKAKERIAPEVEIQRRPVKSIPESPETDFSVLSALPIVPELPVVTPVEETVAAKVVRPKERIAPEVKIQVRPERSAPVPPPAIRVTAVLPPVAPPEPETYIWTPITIPEGPVVHVSPVTFHAEALERKRVAVDELFEKLVWP